MASSTAPVLVVGAGPVGLVAALTLLQSKIPVRIIEKEQEHRRGQRAPGIQARTLEIFHFLGLSDIYHTATAVIPIREYAKGSLEPLCTFPFFPYCEPTPAIPYHNARIIGQSTLEAIMRQHLSNYGCEVELGTQLRSFTQEATCVRAKLVKQQGEMVIEEECEIPFLIGADGAKGITRKQLGLTFLGETHNDHPLLLADLRLELKGLDREHWHIFGARSGEFVSLRPTEELGPDGFQAVISDIAPNTHTPDRDRLFTRITNAIGLDVQFKEVLWLSTFRINVRMVDKFGVGRVFVAGDAAHVHSPSGGQGLNSGVQDAFNIAWKIASVYKGLSPSTLLDTYNAERLPVIAEMLSLTTKLYNQLSGAVKLGDRNATVAQTKTQTEGQRASGVAKEEAQTPDPTQSSLQRTMAREEKLNMLGINYRHSPIIIDEFIPTRDTTMPMPSSSQQVVQMQSCYESLDQSVLCAGDRAPDAPNLVLFCASASHQVVRPSDSFQSGSETRLFDLFSPRYHIVLVFTPTTSVGHEVSASLAHWEREAIRSVMILPSANPDDGKESTSEMCEAESGMEVLIDRLGHSYNAYVVKGGEIKVVIVRPDGVVGAVVHGVAGVQKYFGGIFVKKEECER